MDALAPLDLAVYPLTPERFGDLEALFGPRGAQGGCWCMWWRLPGREYTAGRGESNRLAMKAIVDSGRVPGLLAYHAGRAVGWCAVAPRTEYLRLQRSRTLAPVDDQPVWSIPCFFIGKAYRRRGITPVLLRAAVEFARRSGARIVESYPIDPSGLQSPDAFAYTGLFSTFEKAGFRLALRRSNRQPIMRYTIE